MDGDRIISVLVGLAGACGNNPKTPDTDSLIMRALAFPVLCPEADEEGLAEVVDGLYAEKHAIAPGCAECAFPCGNTSDYDMGRIYGGLCLPEPGAGNGCGTGRGLFMQGNLLYRL